MSNNNSNFKVAFQAALDKAKSITNIKPVIKNIQSKLPPITISGTLDSIKTKLKFNKEVKSLTPKVEVNSDVTQAEKKIKKLEQQKIKTTIQPEVDNSQVISGLKQSQKETMTFWKKFSNNIIGSNLIRMSIQMVTQAISQAILGIKELDKIKTDIQTASGVDDSQVNSMMKSYNQMAKDLSSTTKDIGNAANEIIRMGESLSDTDKLIENSTMLAKIGMIDSSQAAEYLISSMKGFQISAEDSTEIIDKLTGVDMEAAVSAGGLAEAMSCCADIANTSGTSMDRLIGYMATVGEVTQDSMSVIGNSFKSMYSRMNNIKIGKLVDDETGESLSDTEAVLNKLGIRLKDTQNTYRAFDDVLDDVGNNWKNFTQAEQNEISAAIAGTMQRERFIALMNNYSSALEYSEISANSAGSALEKYGVYQDSIEAKTNELTAAIESLSTNIVSEELYSGIIQATTGLVEFLDKTNLLKTSLSGLIAMGISKAFVAISTGIITVAKSTAQLTAAMALFNKGRDADNLRNIGAACNGLTDRQLKLILSTKGLSNAQRLQILAGMEMEEEERKQILTTLGFANAENVATASTFTLKNAMSTLWTTIAANPIGVIVTAVSAITMAFSAYKQHQEKVRQETEEAQEAITNAQSKLKEVSTTLSENKDRFLELSKGVSRFSANLTLSEEEYAEYLSISQKLADISPSLISGYDEQGNALIDIGSNAEETTAKLNELLETQQNISKQTLVDNLDAVAQGIYYEVKESKGSITQLEQELNSLKSEASEINLDIADIVKNGNGIFQFTDVNDPLRKYRNTLIAALKSANIGWEDLGNDQIFVNDFSKAANNGGKDGYEVMDIALKEAQGYYDAMLNVENNVHIANINGLENKLADKEKEIKAAYCKMSANLQAWAEQNFNYQYLSDSSQALVNELIPQIDWNSLEIDLFSGQDYQDYINSNILMPLMNVKPEDKTEIEQAFSKLLSFEDDNLDILPFAEQLQKRLNELNITIDITPLISNEQDIQNKYNKVLRETKRQLDGYGHDDRGFETNNDTGKELDDFFKENVKTQDDIALWTDVTKGITDATDAMNAYTEAKKAYTALNDETPLSISETIDQFNTQLKPAMDSLKSAWNNIFTTDSNGNDIFISENVDLSMLDSIKSSIDNLNKIDEINIDYSSFEDLVSVLTNTDSTADDVKSKINSLATDIVNALNPSMSACSGESYKMVQKLLESIGIMNSEAVMISSLGYSYEEYIAAKEEAANAGLDLANATQDEIDKFVYEKDGSVRCGEALALLHLKKLLVNSTAINTASDIQQIINLASAAGMGAEVLTQLSNAKSILSKVESGETVSLASYEKALSDIDDAKETMLDWQPVEVDFSALDKGAKSASNTAKETQKEADIMSELKSEMDKLQSAYKSLCDIRDTYNEHGKITIDQYQELTDLGFGFLSTLVDENGQLGLNANAFEQLSNAKLQEMQIQIARNALDTINGLKSEAEAVEFLTYTNNNLRNAALGAAEAQLYAAQAAATGKKREAADLIVQGYEATKQLVGKVEFGFDPSEMNKVAEDTKKSFMDAYNEEKKLLDHMKSMGEINNSEYYEKLMKLAEAYFGGNEEYRDNLWEVQEQYHDYLESIKKTYNWIENLLSALSKKTNALISKAEKFISWQKKNAMLNRAIKSTDKQITGQSNAYAYYAEKARRVGLNNTYIDKIQNGTLTIEDMQNESLSGKIEKYQEWYDKMAACEDAISELYEQERDLIRQKLEHVIDYYSEIDSYMSSIVSKMDSFISLMDDMGRRRSLSDLLEQFAATNEQIAHFQSQTTTTKKENDKNYFDSSKRVEAAKKEDTDELINSLTEDKNQVETGIKDTGTYKKLLQDIEKAQKAYDDQYNYLWAIDPEKDKNGRKSEAAQKKLDQLEDRLNALFNKKDELEAYATANNIVAYSRIYDQYMYLYNKREALEAKGMELSEKDSDKMDSLFDRMIEMGQQRDDAIKELENQINIANGKKEGPTEAENLQKQIEDIKNGVINSATYQNIENDIDAVQAKIDRFWETHDSATAAQQKQLDSWESQLEAYYEKQKQLEENATADTVAEYSKVYDAWRKLQDKLDAGKVLSVAEYKNYNKYNEQLKQFADERSSILSSLENQLEKVLNPGDKITNINREYEEAAEGIYKSYQSQIDNIDAKMKSSKQYQDLLAKKQNLENIRDTRGLNASQENNLRKYTAELEALEKGGTGNNIAAYMKTWELWYDLQQKLDNGIKLNPAQSGNYDKYKSQLEAWNKEKQTQISDLTDIMNDELEKLRETTAQNISEAEQEVNSYYSKIYGLAKQIAEYNINTLKEQLAYLDAYISYYNDLVSLYDRFSGDKLSGLLTDLDESAFTDQINVYEKYLDTLHSKYDATLSEINEYKQLIDAIDTNDFQASMDLFRKAMDNYNATGNTEMAEKLQSVLDLLNERAVDADNWGEYADLWLNEWEQALASAKSGLIETAGSIQEINDALREVRFSNITDAIDELERAGSILSSIEGLIKDDWLFESDGSLSEYGHAKAALLVSQLEDAQAKANEYLNLYNKIQENEETYASDKDFKAASSDALQNYYDALGSAASLENSIMELMKKNSEEEINHLKDVIDARKKALQAKKEYYDYDKSIKNSQKEIDRLKAQRDAIKNLTDTTDAATKAKLAQLEAEIAEKEEALQETKDEHTFNLQIDALDKFSDSLTDALDESTKSVEEILQNQKEVIESAKELYKTSTDSVNETIDKLTAFYSGMGVTIDGMDLVPDNARPGAVDKFIEEASEAFANDVLVRTSDAQMLKVYDQDMLEFIQEHLPSISTAVQPIPNFINEANERNSQSIEVNMQYDSLIHIDKNGCIDKNFYQSTILECVPIISRRVQDDIYEQIMLLK